MPLNPKPKKSLGQNFLINPHILDKIVLASEISADDIVLEIGPGTGLLTKKLAEKAEKVIAVEKDHRLIELLKETFKERPNVEIVEGDVLDFKIKELFENFKLKIENYKIVANIPYYITSNLLRTIFESPDWQMAQPKLIVFTIQKEVAKRIIAKPPRMNLLALSVQYYSEPKIIGIISKNNFNPVPKVDSAIIKLVPKDKYQTLHQEGERLFPLIKAGFSEKRKQLLSLLSKKLRLDKSLLLEAFKKCEVKETARAENLSLSEWENLAKNLFG